ncbi:MAG: glutathione S-transferase N-terminal domain-containing protein [Myxococcales bacterium]|nr:glutathione S-transferase N-terminal domain-containing protein [Myxococcales bacterium]
MGIKIYTTQYCGYCRAAKRFLDEKSIPYDEIDLTHNSRLREEISHKSGMYTVPMIFIGAACIGGYTELIGLDRSGQLESMLRDELD